MITDPPGSGYMAARVAFVAVLVALLVAALASQGVHTEPQAQYTRMARAAISDLLTHYWIGSPTDGHIADTWHGMKRSEATDYEVKTWWERDSRGSLWERATLLFAIEDAYRATGDSALLARIKSELKYVKAGYKADDLDNSPGTMIAQGCDDVGWVAWMWIVFYRATKDPYALERASKLVDKAWVRWADDAMGGGLWYSDKRETKSTYQCPLIMASLSLWEYTKEERFRDRAIEAYNWVEKHLGREDGLYWADRNKDGPLGAERPYDIHEAGSVTFLGGNVLMGVLHARLYRMTGNGEYLKRAGRTADAIAKYETDGNGVLLNDRDAWADGCFFGEWATEVLSLPGIEASHRELLRATARSIQAKARTADGHYGGCWSGPAGGDGDKWAKIGSTPQQITVSSNTADVLISAALLRD
jgi:rhamnogalacturonyl hydrolase YesR